MPEPKAAANGNSRWGGQWSRVAFCLLLLILLSAFGGLAVAEDESTPNPEVGPGAVELPGARTATSNTYELPDGKRETVIYESPVNFRDGGEWKPISDGLEEQPDGSGLTNAANSFDLSLPDRMGEGAVRLDTGEAWVSQELLGFDTAPAEVEGTAATYTLGNDNVSFELTSISAGVKETIELADASQPRVYRFRLETASGVAPKLTEAGSIEYRDQDGEVVAETPAPFMEDSSPEPKRSTDAVYELSSDASDAWTLTVNANSDWLSDPERVWPVKIDPTTVVSNPATYADCEIYTYETFGGGSSPGGACSSASKYEDLPAFRREGANTLRSRALLKFALGAIPTNAAVVDASLSVYHPESTRLLPAAVQVRELSAEWDSKSTWIRRIYGTIPATNWTAPGGDFTSNGGELQSSVMGSKSQWWTFQSGMRNIVGRWVSGAIANNGVLLKVGDETSCSADCDRGQFNFINSGYSNASFRPQLKLIWYPAAPATSKLASPMEGTTTARRLKLMSAWSAETANPTGVRYQFRVGKTGTFEDIPLALVRDASGKQPSAWPVALTEAEKTARSSDPLYFDAAHAAQTLRESGGSIQVRAIFDGATNIEGYTDAVEARVNRKIGGAKDATAPVGPGNLDLLTGNLNISRQDVRIPGFKSSLSFSRTYNTREPGAMGDPNTVLGLGWKPTVPVEEAGGSEWQNIKIVHFSETIEDETEEFDYAVLTFAEGFEISFEKVGASFVTPPELAGMALRAQGTNQLVLTDPGGNQTTFENQSGGTEYLPVSITQTGASSNSTKLVYQFVGGQKRLKMVIAPAAPGLVCNTEADATTKQGCKALEFVYENAKNWSAPESYGDRLARIRYSAPGFSQPWWTVSEYAYDTSGRLIGQWDPRISSEVKETYTYESGKLRKVTPRGQEPWTLEYTAGTDGETGISRLKSLTRATLLASPSTAKTSIRYEVPISGGPYDLSGAAVATWGQTDIPVDATAIFPPSEVPGEPAASYAKATIYYMDSDGFAVNTATPAGAGTTGASISTTEADQFGNVVRELTAQNRLRALGAGAESVKRSHELETKMVYSPDGTEMQEELGPLHQVRLESGTLKQARFHKTVQYDECGTCTWTPANPKPHLPTRETTGASIPGVGIDADQTVVEYRYNWTLRAQTETITDPSGLNIRRKAIYDEQTGLLTEQRQPKEAETGSGVGTTKVVYYKAAATSNPAACEASKVAGLICKIEPAAQPGVAGQPNLPIRQILSYNQLGQPLEETEAPPIGESRKTTFTYDSAGRQLTKETSGGGVTVPKVQTEYESANGLPSAERFICPPGEPECDQQTISVSYDKLGRLMAYKDADGNTAETTYDYLGRPATVNDGKGTQTFRYDLVTGLLVELEDSSAGLFTASYDADGRIVRQILPDGLSKETSFDEVGQRSALTYTKASDCGASCTWLTFSVDRSINGQILLENGTLGNDEYAYDKIGRLVSAHETPAGGSCVTRSYVFDKNSNRTERTTISGLGAVCSASGGTTQKYSYDSADRLLGEGIVYDDFGRIKSLPGSMAGGNALATTYFSNDMVATQSQNGVTNTFQLDASLRQRQRLQAGGLLGTEVFHYGAPSDAPSWTERGTTWARNIMGIGGELAAIQESGKEVELQLTNLHGDVSATAALSSEVTSLKATFTYDEFGIQTSPASGGRFGWLGGQQRRTELASGVVQMGARSYVPQIGRFLTIDSVQGGSANGYDYAGADPINGFDLEGTCIRRKHSRKCQPKIRIGMRPSKQKAGTEGPPLSPVPDRVLTHTGGCNFFSVGIGHQEATSVLVTMSIVWSCGEDMQVSAYLHIIDPSNVGPTSYAEGTGGVMGVHAYYKGVQGAPLELCLYSSSSEDGEYHCQQGIWVHIAT